jgi:hypothetical protein
MTNNLGVALEGEDGWETLLVVENETMMKQ